jgi:hypothetical protein
LQALPLFLWGGVRQSMMADCCRPFLLTGFLDKIVKLFKFNEGLSYSVDPILSMDIIVCIPFIVKLLSSSIVKFE